MAPLRDLVTFLEGDHTPACYVFPAIQCFQKKMQDIIETELPEIASKAKMLYEKIISRVSHQYSFVLLRLFYFLTPIGREYAREIFSSYVSDVLDGIHSNPDELPNYSDSMKKIEKLIKDFDPSEEKYERMKNIFTSIKAKDKPSLEPNEEDEIGFEEEDCCDDGCDFSNVNFNAYVNCIGDLALKFSKSMNIDLELQEQYANRIMDGFISWIIEPIQDRTLLACYHRNPPLFWKIASETPELKEFSDFVLRILPTIASEATVERKLWRQRIVSPPERASNSEMTELNRVLVSIET